jgi:hypothetical protein
MGKSRRDERHQVRLKLNRFYLDASMMQNSFLMNPFRDTLYYSDLFVSNTKRITGGGGYNFKQGYVSLAYGHAQSTMQSFSSLPEYRTVDLYGSFQFKKIGAVQLSNVIGYDHKKNFNGPAMSWNSRINYSKDFLSITGIFIRTPVFREENNKRVLTGFHQMMNAGPTVRFSNCPLTQHQSELSDSKVHNRRCHYAIHGRQYQLYGKKEWPDL